MRLAPVDPSLIEAGCTSKAPLTEVAAVVEVSADLLNRALVGWERFLGTFEGAASDE
ncbi:hypothetical protein [Streptomyces sp. NPDC054797]